MLFRSIFQGFAPDTEVYSVDEAFLNLSGYELFGLNEYAIHIRDTVKQWTGIPTSIGIAHTKTLAKLANRLAKKNPVYNGVCVLKTEKDILEALHTTMVEDIWGIGKGYAATLHSYGIHTCSPQCRRNRGLNRFG